MAVRQYADWLMEQEDLSGCAVLLRAGSKTFHLASRALPRQYRAAATALYAFCRVADDAIDDGADPVLALAELQDRLDRIYEGNPLPLPTDRAFARVAKRYGVPKTLPAALLDGFAWDAAGRRYETISDVRAYAARVAGSVGVCMALIMQVRDPHILARACDLGIAMQLTNIARDVGEDARAGRLYLPREWLAEEGIDPEVWLAAPSFHSGIARTVARLLEEAEVYYARAAHGIPALPAGCRSAINAARLLYAEIGREVERHGLDSVSRRAVLSNSRKFALLVAALRLNRNEIVVSAVPTAPEAQYLLDAVTQADSVQDGSASGADSVPDLDARIEWFVGLLERLERRDQATA